MTSLTPITPANDTPYGDHVRKQASIEAVRATFYQRWLKLSSDMHAEIERIKQGGE